MISQSTFFLVQALLACERAEGVMVDTLAATGRKIPEGELENLINPYVLVIHRPTGRGFYLNRDYRHIVDVCRCQEPDSPIEPTTSHLCASTNLPAWVFEEDPLFFDTFWLY